MSAENPLEALRLEIDAIDDSIHDLIMRRTRVVERVRDLKSGDPVKIRPSREAKILYRLTARHTGPFPKRELVRIWRELIVATLGFEGPFSVAVFMPPGSPGCWDLARDQYGSFTGLTAHATAADVIGAVGEGKATVGVLPAPAAGEANPWWPLLNSTDGNAPRIIARLPFAGPSNALCNSQGGITDGVVICPIEPEATGRDVTYLSAARDAAGVEKILADAGRTVIGIADDPASGLCLAEVEGFITGDDNLGVPIGSYARPLSAEDLT